MTEPLDLEAIEAHVKSEGLPAIEMADIESLIAEVRRLRRHDDPLDQAGAMEKFHRARAEKAEARLAQAERVVEAANLFHECFPETPYWFVPQGGEPVYEANVPEPVFLGLRKALASYDEQKGEG